MSQIYMSANYQLLVFLQKKQEILLKKFKRKRLQNLNSIQGYVTINQFVKKSVVFDSAALVILDYHGHIT